jgi:hypothetical protein
MQITREWAMPNKDTFQCPPIRSFVMKYLRESKVSVDPFACNFQGCTYTNDLNPNTAAQYHMDARDFLSMLVDKQIRADFVVFDPPYNPSQAKQLYEEIGLNLPARVGRAAGVWAEEKTLAAHILTYDGIFLWFGWNTNGMGKKRGFSIQEILLVAHGRGHNDTICMAERRTSEQQCLLPYVN